MPKMAKWPLASVVRSGPLWLLRPQRIMTLQPAIGSAFSFLTVPSTRARPPFHSWAWAAAATAAIERAARNPRLHIMTNPPPNPGQYMRRPARARGGPIRPARSGFRPGRGYLGRGRRRSAVEVDERVDEGLGHA